jgi:anti-sigma-K factor RskA
MTHGEMRESLAGYALHALADDEARELEAHLATCEECREELALLQDAAASLAPGFVREGPPEALRDRIRDAVRAPAVVPLGDPSRARRMGSPDLQTHRPQPGRAGLLALAVAAALIIVVAGFAVSLEQRFATLRAQVGTERQALAVLADPSSRVVTLSGSAAGNVRFVFDPAKRRGVLVATGLRDPGPDFVYQLWLVAGAAPESVGVFRPAPGAPVIVPVGADFPRYQAVAVSVERGPNGAPRPSAAPVLVARLGPD